MYERILVPLDGSQLAEVALPYARSLAEKPGSAIDVVYVEEFNLSDALEHLPKPQSNEGAPDRYSAEKYLEGVAKKAPEAKSTVLFGHPAEAIVEYANTEDIGLIVMATHGRSGIRLWALGSVADKVVRASNRPVMLIRARGSHPDIHKRGGFKKILVPLDGSEESERILPYVRELGIELKAELVLFQAIERATHLYLADMVVTHLPYSDEEMEPFKADAENYLEKIKSSLESDGITLSTKVGIGETAEWIIEFADEIDADLVAMATHGRSGIRQWQLGNVAQKVMHAGNTPLMLVKSSEEAVPG
ncbi:MAG: universal stress protein [Dehalococcoidia bacterium]